MIVPTLLGTIDGMHQCTGKVAVIGSLSDIEAIVQGKAGTRIGTAKPGITYLK